VGSVALYRQFFAWRNRAADANGKCR